MSKKTKLKIGAFPKMMQVTVKTLRHYEQKGLLVPKVIKISGVCQELKNPCIRHHCLYITFLKVLLLHEVVTNGILSLY